ncbi:ArsR/SmtB family transcription factor [Sandaracinobacteroides sp. A072]|uniref:ArsR/SmtB family transcription factor n=1 Tax=Sandaracinobacteroides sp. A072 TaxID=3461146 RepID=UPI004043219D
MRSLTDIFAALADPTRVRILLLVRDMQLSMGELADLLDQSHPRVSRHVRILAEAGLVKRQKEGAWVFVSLGDQVPAPEIFALLDRLDPQGSSIASERARLGQVRAERQKAVDDWFRAHAGEWDLMRRLGGQEDAVEAAIVSAARRPFVGRLLDIGTGTGRILELLAAEAESATGVDRSPEMLRIARGKLTADGEQTADLRQSDMRSLPFGPGSFDTITLHHVLHFAEDPAGAIAEAARLLAPGGKLLVADYAPHGQEELRSRFHHVRLGFEDAAILGWMAASGLGGRILSAHPGPELTVKIWEGRR